VLDVQLPLDIVRCLTLEYPHVPVIILTDIGNHLPGEEALSLDTRPCLLKPFQIEKLPDAIKESLDIISLDTACPQEAAEALHCWEAKGVVRKVSEPWPEGRKSPPEEL
jgi:hypothetical protein